MHDILSNVLNTVQILAKQDTQVVNLVLANQMDVLEDGLETATTALQTLHNKKLAVDFLTHDQVVTLWTIGIPNMFGIQIVTVLTTFEKKNIFRTRKMLQFSRWTFT